MLAFLTTLVVAFPASMRAQTFQAAQPLFFTMPYQGANPLPQVLTVASTGAGFSFYTSVSTSSGGTWLNTSSNSTYAKATPYGITVGINAAINMAPGTYTGTITLTSTSSPAKIMTIPVTLAIQQASATFFDNLPGQLSFSMLTKGSTPPSQPIQVRNAGSGTLSWTGSVSTSDGGNWLNLSSVSGTAPYTISVAINPASLPYGGQASGTYTGQVVLQTPGNTVTVPVSVVLGASVFQQANALNFTMPFQGANPLPQVLTIASTSASFKYFTYPVNSTGSWLTTSSNSTYSQATPSGVTVSVNTAPNMAPGTYTDEIIFQSTDGTMTMTVPVTLTIEQSPATFFDNLPGQISFSMLAKGTTPPSQPLQIRNAGIGNLNWTGSITTSDGGNWLSLSSMSGSAPSIISVGINPASLPYAGQSAGTYTGQVVLQTPGNTVTIPVSVVVGPVSGNVFQQVNALNFTMPFQGANPLPQVLTVASTGVPISFYTYAINSTGNWLTTSSNSTYSKATPYGVAVSVNTAPNMAPGTYTDEIIFQSTDGSMTLTVPVTLTIEPASATFFDNLPGQLSFSMVTKESAPPSQPLQIRNAGVGNLNWIGSVSTSDGGNWLSLSSTSGTAPSTISVTVNPANLPYAGQASGTFTGQMQLQSSGKIVTVPVSIVVGSAVFQQVNALNFTMPFQGANPLPQVITMASTGAAFNFYTYAISSTGSWLTTSSNSTYSKTTPYGVIVSVSTAPNMAPGTYTDEIIFQSTDGTMAMTVPVTLTIEPASATFFDNLPGQLSFSGKPDGSALPSQAFQIRNSGPGTLAWTLATSTSDGGSWLTASAKTGTASSIVTMSVVSANLPYGGLASGTYTGQVVLQTLGKLVTIPVSVQLGANVFQQRQALYLTMPFQGANPSPQVLTVASVGAPFNFYTYPFNSKGSWLTTSSNGTYNQATPYSVTVTVNAATNMPQGTYTDEIVLESTDGTLTMTVPVTLTVGNGGNQTPAAAAPTFTPPAGTYTSAQSVTLADSTPGVTIYYTINGSTPSASSTVYTGPIIVSSTATVQAIAVASGYTNSAVASATYTITSPTPSPKAPGFPSMTYIATGASTTGVSLQAVAADFNGDGYQDLATTNSVDGTVSVLLGKGNGSFQTPATYAVGAGPYGIATGDFNGDGKPDLAVVNGLDSTVSILLNTAGAFPAHPSFTYAVGSQPYGVSVADFNHDGLVDLAVTNNASKTVSVLLGKGNGSFQAASSYATGNYPFGTAVADVNNDGYADLIVWNLGDNNVGVLLNNKAGGFLPQTTYATGADPYSVATGDFNGDGYPDLAVANLGGNSLSVLLNNKAGGFASAVSYKAGLLPASVLAKDLNGDGVLDLAVANLGDGTVGVLPGKGDGTFLAQVVYAAGTQPYSLLSADFNGDGLPDLTVTSFFENTLGVLLQSASTSGKIKATPPKKLLPLPSF